MKIKKIYILLKLLYKERSQITDVFTLGIASIMLILSNIIVYYTICRFTNDYVVCAVIDKVILFIALYLLRSKLPKIQDMYKRFWNRNDKIKKIMKSTTFRCINLVLFNFMFYFINLAMLYCIYVNNVK